MVSSALALACARPVYLDSKTPVAGKANDANGCHATFNESGHCVLIQWEKHPTETEFGSFIFTVRQMTSESTVLPSTLADHPYSEDLAIILWMPSMGHGSSPVKVERLAKGLYRANRVFFNMKGDWEIRFEVANGATGSNSSGPQTDQAIYALFL
jgi:hypothetical protein